MADEFDKYLEKMNTMNKESAKEQMDFQERMSSTAHQREVKDLLAAGLNPVLSANNGASSPGGAYANVDNTAVSAKFARQNLERELANQRTIAAMNNENAMKIAMAQIASNYELGIYTSNNALEASKYSADMQKAIKEMDINNPDSLSEFLIRFFQGGYSEAAGNSASGIKDIAKDVIKHLVTSGNGYSVMKANAVAAGENVSSWLNYQAKKAAAKKAANNAKKSVLKNGGSYSQAMQAYYDTKNNYTVSKTSNFKKHQFI